MVAFSVGLGANGSGTQRCSVVCGLGVLSRASLKAWVFSPRVLSPRPGCSLPGISQGLGVLSQGVLSQGVLCLGVLSQAWVFSPRLSYSSFLFL